MKQVYKYGTGQEIPEGAVFLSTVKQEQILDSDDGETRVYPCWFVWHYFLVDVEA